MREYIPKDMREHRARQFLLDSEISLRPNSTAALSMVSVKGLIEKVDSTHQVSSFLRYLSARNET